MTNDSSASTKIGLKRLGDCIAALGSVAALCFLIQYFPSYISAPNIPVLFLLNVMVVALFFGRVAAIICAVCAFLAINWFFVTPRYTFSVQEPTEWISLCIFLFTAIVTGQLMALLKARASEARQHQRETAAIADASWAIASHLDNNSALMEVVQQLAKVVEIRSAAVISFESLGSRLVAAYPDGLAQDWSDPDLLRWTPGNLPTKATDDCMYLPIEMNKVTLGFMLIELIKGRKISSSQKQIVDTLVNHAAIILQRDELMKIESRAAALADADRLKTALLSMVSHDFRSPLTSIKACVSTLLADGEPIDSETQKSLYQAIEQETDRINRVVGNILDLSRLEADAWRPKKELISVTELAGMALDSFNSQADSRISVQLEDKSAELYVDCVQMVQVLKNLIENALKYSAAESPVILRFAVEDNLNRIDVIDCGRGIAIDELAQIFEPFYRGKDFQESAVPGVGIGLAVCRGLVEAHGGKLIAQNRAEGGAIFSIFIPLEMQKEINVPITSGDVH